MYGGFEWLNESYFLADRPDVKDRFFGFEKRLIGGVQMTLWRNALIDLNSGYAFDRYFAEGTNQNSGLHDRVDIAPGVFLAGGSRNPKSSPNRDMRVCARHPRRRVARQHQTPRT
jgi:hypothetical protein